MLACSAMSLHMSAQVFYEVEAPVIGTVSYILGTHHFAPLENVDTLPGLSEVLDKVSAVYGEVDMAEMAKPETMMKMQSAMMAPPDSTLSLFLAPAQLDSVSTAFGSLAGMPVPAAALNGFKPAGISTQIAQMLAMKANPGFEASAGMDMTMQSRAKNAGKRVGGLETIDRQLDVLFNSPLQQQADALMEVVRDMDATERESIEMTQAYLNHDMEAIGKLIEDMHEKDPAAAERMIYGRNDAWIAKLKEMLPVDSVFVVVGAGHLPGERGLLNQLEKSGYKVKPLG